LIVTPVLPLTALTGVLLVPVHVTVVPDTGVVVVHCAIAGDDRIEVRVRTAMAADAGPTILPVAADIH
jgi:hypothetical protein